MVCLGSRGRRSVLFVRTCLDFSVAACQGLKPVGRRWRASSSFCLAGRKYEEGFSDRFDAVFDEMSTKIWRVGDGVKMKVVDDLPDREVHEESKGRSQSREWQTATGTLRRWAKTSRIIQDKLP